MLLSVAIGACAGQSDEVGAVDTATAEPAYCADWRPQETAPTWDEADPSVSINLNERFTQAIGFLEAIRGDVPPALAEDVALLLDVYQARGVGEDAVAPEDIASAEQNVEDWVVSECGAPTRQGMEQ